MQRTLKDVDGRNFIFSKDIRQPELAVKSWEHHRNADFSDPTAMMISGFTGRTCSWHCVWCGDQCCVAVWLFPPSSMYLLCSLIAQLLVDRTSSYPPELGNTMVSLFWNFVFQTGRIKIYYLSAVWKQPCSSEAGSPDWSQGSFRSGPETGKQTKAQMRPFQNTLVPRFVRLQGMKDVSNDCEVSTSSFLTANVNKLAWRFIFALLEQCLSIFSCKILYGWYNTHFLVV